jgi:hypothetical protein
MSLMLGKGFYGMCKGLLPYPPLKLQHGLQDGGDATATPSGAAREAAREAARTKRRDESAAAAAAAADDARRRAELELLLLDEERLAAGAGPCRCIP